MWNEVQSITYQYKPEYYAWKRLQLSISVQIRIHRFYTTHEDYNEADQGRKYPDEIQNHFRKHTRWHLLLIKRRENERKIDNIKNIFKKSDKIRKTISSLAYIEDTV